jgi:hypothetical protein
MSQAHPLPSDAVLLPARPSVYARLQTLRVALYQSKIAKSGRNNHLTFTYFELADFLPKVMELCVELELCGVFSFDDERAVLSIIDTHDPAHAVTFTMPASLSVRADERFSAKTLPMQLTGSDQTYLRRYLWRQALELVESDFHDSTVATIRLAITQLIEGGDVRGACQIHREKLSKDIPLRKDVWAMLNDREKKLMRNELAIMDNEKEKKSGNN